MDGLGSGRDGNRRDQLGDGGRERVWGEVIGIGGNLEVLWKQCSGNFLEHIKVRTSKDS